MGTLTNLSIDVQEADFDVGAELAALSHMSQNIGAVVSFVGLVRADRATASIVGTGDTVNVAEIVQAITLEHYPGMTEQELQRIATQATERWTLSGIRIIHRIGRLIPGDRIVLVAVSGEHRGETFSACEFIIDYLKTQAPFWKKETLVRAAESLPDNTYLERWVEAKETDGVAQARW